MSILQEDVCSITEDCEICYSPVSSNSYDDFSDIEEKLINTSHRSPKKISKTSSSSSSKVSEKKKRVISKILCDSKPPIGETSHYSSSHLFKIFQAFANGETISEGIFDSCAKSIDLSKTDLREEIARFVKNERLDKKLLQRHLLMFFEQEIKKAEYRNIEKESWDEWEDCIPVS